MLLPPGLGTPGRLCLMPQPVCYALPNRLSWPLRSTAAVPLIAMSQDHGGRVDVDKPGCSADSLFGSSGMMVVLALESMAWVRAGLFLCRSALSIWERRCRRC